MAQECRRWPSRVYRRSGVDGSEIPPTNGRYFTHRGSNMRYIHVLDFSGTLYRVLGPPFSGISCGQEFYGAAPRGPDLLGFPRFRSLFELHFSVGFPEHSSSIAGITLVGGWHHSAMAPRYLRSMARITLFMPPVSWHWRWTNSPVGRRLPRRRIWGFPNFGITGGATSNRGR
jgi:hypothetical protein